MTKIILLRFKFRFNLLSFRPQPVTEKSLMDSVAGFINEVQTFNQPNLPTDPKVYVLWARFEVADINDIKLLPERIELNGKKYIFFFNSTCFPGKKIYC